MSDNGQISRRLTVQAGLAACAAVLVSRKANAESYNDQPKVDRTATHYQYHPNAEGSHCSICSNFIAPASCRVIEGVIDPNGYCLAFAPLDR